MNCRHPHGSGARQIAQKVIRRHREKDGQGKPFGKALLAQPAVVFQQQLAGEHPLPAEGGRSTAPPRRPPWTPRRSPDSCRQSRTTGQTAPHPPGIPARRAEWGSPPGWPGTPQRPQRPIRPVRPPRPAALPGRSAGPFARPIRPATGTGKSRPRTEPPARRRAIPR